MWLTHNNKTPKHVGKLGNCWELQFMGWGGNTTQWKWIEYWGNVGNRGLWVGNDISSFWFYPQTQHEIQTRNPKL